jgi:hypothetical protein
MESLSIYPVIIVIPKNLNPFNFQVLRFLSFQTLIDEQIEFN